MKMKTRFAPSPTGHVHIGNIRVAIYNWLFARHHGGAFLLRMEDTDQERSTEEAVQTVLSAMKWMGLEADEQPLYQSSRRTAHLEAAERLLSAGLAYRDNKGGKGECTVFRMPDTDSTYHDEVKGALTKKAGDMQDLVIVRSNGTPVFHLANVVDDIHMGITHVIRGDDHVENTFRHIALYRALGADIPHFAHLPMIVNHQGKPYSKRDGAAYIGDFRERGYLASAMVNYLALLGWSPGDDREVMRTEELIDLFTLARVQASPAQMDMKKLTWLNGEHMQQLPREIYRKRIAEELTAAGTTAHLEDTAHFEKVLALMADRIKVWADVVPMMQFFFHDDFAFDEKAVNKRLRKPGTGENIKALAERFRNLETFDADALEQALTGLAEATGHKTGDYIHPVRVAVSGISMGPGLYEMLAVLGRDKVLERMRKAVETFC